MTGGTYRLGTQICARGRLCCSSDKMSTSHEGTPLKPGHPAQIETVGRAMAHLDGFVGDVSKHAALRKCMLAEKGWGCL